MLYLEDGSVVEEGEQLQEVVQDVALLLLHAQDVGRMERLRAVDLQLLVERKETELEEILDDDGGLRAGRQTAGRCQTDRQVVREKDRQVDRQVPRYRLLLSSRRFCSAAAPTVSPTETPRQEVRG